MTTHEPLPASDTLDLFEVADPTFVVETLLAGVWKVTRADGSPAAFKVYQNDMDNEALGFQLLQRWNGNGAARLYGTSHNAALLEWLDGPSLGDLVRNGDDDSATKELVSVARTIHQAYQTTELQLETLHDWFDALFSASYAPDAPSTMRDTIRRATQIAHELMGATETVVPLHGDLHHDNIKGSASGFLAFDAKGVLGDRHFELANAFRNPVGLGEIYGDPEVILRRARHWAEAFDTNEKLLLKWAAAQSALSLCWTTNGRFGPDLAEDARLIDTFLRLLDSEA